MPAPIRDAYEVTDGRPHTEIVFPLVEDGGPREPPREFRLFYAGENPTTKGTFVFDEDAARSVMEEYRSRGLPLMADYEHQSLCDPPIIAIASVTEWTPEIRNGELWATRVKWTERAAEYLRNGEYRLFSNAFDSDKKTNRVLRMINFALTNLPAANRITPLVSARQMLSNAAPAERAEAVERWLLRFPESARDQLREIALSASPDTSSAPPVEAGSPPPQPKKENRMSKLGDHLTQKMTALGLSRDDLGKAIGKDGAFVAKLLETPDGAHTKEHRATFRALSDRIGVKLTQMFALADGEDPPAKKDDGGGGAGDGDEDDLPSAQSMHKKLGKFLKRLSDHKHDEEEMKKFKDEHADLSEHLKKLADKSAPYDSDDKHAEGLKSTCKRLRKLKKSLKKALGAYSDKGEAMSKLSHGDTDLTSLGREVVRLTGKGSAAEALATVNGRFTAAEKAEAESVRLTAMEQKLAAQEKRERLAEFDRVVSDAKREGRLSPAEVNNIDGGPGKYIAQLRSDGVNVAALRAFVEALPKKVTPGVALTEKKLDETEIASVTLSDDEKRIAAGMGVTEKDALDRKRNMLKAARGVA